MIEIKEISKQFGKLRVLSNINLDISKPGIYAVLGPNSSGKTTLIKTLLGMVIPSAGKVFFDGINISGNFIYRENISYMPQIARFPENLTGIELISMIQDIRGEKSDIRELVRLFELEEHLEKKMKDLSGGTKQKINAVLALMFDTQYLFLDEPTAGLDPLALVRFKELVLKLKEEEKTIILTTHVIDLVEDIADNIIFLLEGKIYFIGAIKTLMDNHKSSSLEKAIATILDENKHV